MEPKRGQVYQFPDHDGNPAKLIIVSVSDTHVEYKLLNHDDSMGRYTYPMTLDLWNQSGSDMKFKGEIVLTADD